jgi:hypothetical protein
LGAFEDQHLEQAPIVMARDAPLLVVVADVERVARPGAPPHAPDHCRPFRARVSSAAARALSPRRVVTSGILEIAEAGKGHP